MNYIMWFAIFLVTIGYGYCLIQIDNHLHRLEKRLDEERRKGERG